MTKPKKPNWSKIKTVLMASDQRKSLELIRDLFKQSQGNRRFIEARLFPTVKTLEEYRKRVENSMFPDLFQKEPVGISTAKKAITEYKNATGDNDGELDLMVSFVEFGTRFTVEYGDMWEGFYSSLESMFQKVLTRVAKCDQARRAVVMARLEEIVESASGLGWGYYDALEDMLGEAMND